MFTKKLAQQTASIVLVVSIVLLAVKFFAYYLTGSKAALSDAVESIVNVVAGLFLLVSLNISTTPPDESHPYGHGKIEFFSAGLEGGLIVFAAIMILIETIPEFFHPGPPRDLDTGILLLLGAGCVNMGLGVYLLRLGGKYNSDALKASGHHVMTDFYTSAGVIVGLVVVRLTGWRILDPLMACLVALNIVLPGTRLIWGAMKNLMDEADPDIIERIVAALCKIKQPGLLCPHALRVLRSGRNIHIDLHINLPSYWPLDKVHATEKATAKALMENLGEQGDVMIHVDPCRPNCCPCCSIEVCAIRAQPFVQENHWTAAAVVEPTLTCPLVGLGTAAQ